MASRRRVRDQFRDAMRTRSSLAALAQQTKDEYFFAAGKQFKERNDGVLLS